MSEGDTKTAVPSFLLQQQQLMRTGVGYQQTFRLEVRARYPSVRFYICST